ncbi:hypothetical protein BDR05DRAFT_963352 [Suillus weaverae]|nr:hypothetical protein BDR05DRAFT_963352 [Suillus weaverae]
MSFPDNKPIFVPAQVPPMSEHRLLMMKSSENRFSFIEVRPDSKDGPNTTNTAVVKQIVLQGAEYAKFIMAVRPFQLYVLCVFIYSYKIYLGCSR